MGDLPVDEYLARLDPSQRDVLARIRHIIQRVAPHATETMSYGMPTYKINGKKLLYFAAFKNHMSLFGALGPVESKLSGFKLSHKGTVQFTTSKPLPDHLVEEIVRQRLMAVNEL